MVDDLTYRGVPLWDLRIEEVVWSPDNVEHMLTRAERRGTNELDIEAEWATEAALDVYRLARESESSALEVVGLSAGAPRRTRLYPGRVLKVWLLPTDEPLLWAGQSACEASRGMEKLYWEERWNA